MILAAGLGTRLRPLTDSRPKALVEVAGRTLLEITVGRLQAFGIREVIINVHHFADMIIDYLKANRNFDMRVEVSREEVLLDTGGGLKKAAHFFLDDARDGDEPFVLHNVDVISTVDLRRMADLHRRNNAVATLAVQHRDSSRYLLFDRDLRLCGRQIGSDSKDELVQHSPQLEPLAFCGIHMISVRFLKMITEEGIFSIIKSYLRLAAQGQKILGFRADQYYWQDLGKPENLKQAAEDVKEGVLLPD